MLRASIGLVCVAVVALSAWAQSEHYPPISHAELPPYPALARALNLTGAVEIQFVIAKGIVSDAQLKSVVFDCRACTQPLTEEGKNRIGEFISVPSLANIKKWRFKSDTGRTTFVVRYVYRIAGKETVGLKKPNVKAHLPLVTVTARPVKQTVLY